MYLCPDIIISTYIMSSTVYLIKCFNDALGGSELMSEPRYAQIARDITGGMTSGRFPVGSILPTELELCDQYGVSRHTIRAALRQLQDLGLVSRRKRAGTRVEAVRRSSGYNQSLASVEEVLEGSATDAHENGLLSAGPRSAAGSRGRFD